MTKTFKNHWLINYTLSVARGYLFSYDFNKKGFKKKGKPRALDECYVYFRYDNQKQ